MDRDPIDTAAQALKELAKEWHSRGYNRGLSFTEEACCESCAFDAESNARQYADFCYGDAADLNGLPSEDLYDDDDEAGPYPPITSEEAWEAYDEGIGDAITSAGLPESCKDSQ